jgi:hypothetical protein
MKLTDQAFDVIRNWKQNFVACCCSDCWPDSRQQLEHDLASLPDPPTIDSLLAELDGMQGHYKIELWDTHGGNLWRDMNHLCSTWCNGTAGAIAALQAEVAKRREPPSVSNAELLAKADAHPAPQEWYDEQPAEPEWPAWGCYGTEHEAEGITSLRQFPSNNAHSIGYYRDGCSREQPPRLEWYESQPDFHLITAARAAEILAGAKKETPQSSLADLAWLGAAEREAEIVRLRAENERLKMKLEERGTRTFTPVLDPSLPQTDLSKLTYREEGKE